MPDLSIVIAAYNVERYLAACLDSVTAQTLSTIEIIVVDDASTDRTAEIIGSYAEKDSRIIAITNEENRGLHLTRKTGVARAKGDYALFLDGDDELAPDMCEQVLARVQESPVDMLHYGITVIGEEGLLDSEGHAFEAFINTPSIACTGDDVVKSIYDEGLCQRIDWRTTQRLYRTDVLRSAFEEMTDSRLERAEDSYETFVIAAHSSSSAGAEDCRGYLYHYGRGITGTNAITPFVFARFCKQFKACIDESCAYAVKHPEKQLESCYDGLKHKAVELLANDWKVRVPESDKVDAAHLFADTFTGAIAAREVYRFVRDRAYELWVNGDDMSLDDPLVSWSRIASSIVVVNRKEQLDDIRRYREMRQVAENHFADIVKRTRLRGFDKQSIRIFVSTHKEVDYPISLMLQPVQVGCAARDWTFSDTFHDNEGENISEFNPYYCELTTQYWAWKNVHADYVGFCHYRRYFDFSGIAHKENAWGEVMANRIDQAAMERYGLDDESIERAVSGYDIVTTGLKNLAKFPGSFKTPYRHYREAPYLHIADLDLLSTIVCREHPDYKQDVDAYLNGSRTCFCNMFIMRAQLFDEYCSWLFPILELWMRESDMSHYSKEALRTPGHLGERLLNIWLVHQKRLHPEYRTKELPCVHFEHPERQKPIEPLELDVADPRAIVPVVFASDDKYVPMLTTTILSMLENASKDRFYDIVVLEHDISEANKKAMRTFFSCFANVRIRYCDVAPYVSGHSLVTNNEHISAETYYRFLVQEILPFYDKVLYLDSDLLVLGDVAELFDTDLEDKLLAAAYDIDFAGNVNMNDGKRLAYTKDVLKLDDPYDYFQAGVLVLNTTEMRSLHTADEWMRLASDSEYIYDDQDVLNAECEGRVVYLDWSWNVMHDCMGRVGSVFSFAPAEELQAYMESREHPRIVHFAGAEKPWTNARCDYAGLYWEYARRVPFYEQFLIQQMTVAEEHAVFVDPMHPSAVAQDSRLRRVIDPIAPLGSARREVAKSVARVFMRPKNEDGD